MFEVVHAAIESPTILSQGNLWHARLGHQGDNVLASVNTQFKLNMTQSELNDSVGSSCIVCKQGKTTRASVRQTADSQYKATEPLQTLHADLVGPITTPIQTHGKHKTVSCPAMTGQVYSLIVTDEVTHAVFVFLLKKKSETTHYLLNLFKYLQVRTGRLIRRFHTDGGGEFRTTEFLTFLKQNGTEFTHSTAASPERNPVAERMNRSLFEIMRTLMIQSVHLHSCGELH